MRDIAIFNTHPNVVNIIGENAAYDVDGKEVALNEVLIDAELARLQAEYEAKEYQRQRAAEYPPITDYLDAIVKGDTAQQQAYIDACLAVKQKYPK